MGMEQYRETNNNNNVLLYGKCDKLLAEIEKTVK
jgi:hypothetical protein